MCQPVYLLHEVNIKVKRLKSTSDVLIITIFQLPGLVYISCQLQSIKFYATTTIALPGNQINLVSVMHFNREHVQLRFGLLKSHILRIVVRPRAYLAVLWIKIIYYM